MKCAAPALLVLSLSACATTTPMKPLTLGVDSLQGTVMVMDYSFPAKNEAVEDGCQLILMRVEDRKGFSMDLHAHRNRSVVSLPSGRYLAREIYCNEMADWRFYERPMSFDVQDGKINYIGALRIRENSSNQSLGIRWSDRPTWATEDIASSLKPEDRTRLVAIVR
jgi:hypothetical protein